LNPGYGLDDCGKTTGTGEIIFHFATTLRPDPQSNFSNIHSVMRATIKQQVTEDEH